MPYETAERKFVITVTNNVTQVLLLLFYRWLIRFHVTWFTSMKLREIDLIVELIEKLITSMQSERASPSISKS